jgi:hypothetical protein
MKPFKLDTVTPAEQLVIQRFWNEFQSATVNIAFRPMFMERKTGGMGVSFMGIITHPSKRVILKGGEIARINCVHPDPDKQHLNNMILIVGTPYGIVVAHGRQKDYRVNGKSTVEGPVPSLHTTTRFAGAAMRYFKRKNIKFTGDADLKAWIFSDNFLLEVEEQATLDRKTESDLSIQDRVAGKSGREHLGSLVGDGLPKRVRQEHPVNKPTAIVHDMNSRRGHTEPVADFQHPSEMKDHPLDIIPCRANGFKGIRYADQTAEQKAAGQRLLAKPEEQLSNAEQFVEETIAGRGKPRTHRDPKA